MSLWETQEVQDELTGLSTLDGLPQRCAEDIRDPDEGKSRATVQQYAALIAQRVMAHLEGLASAWLEKRPRPYQTDAEIHQSYIQATSGGAGEPGDEPHDGPTVSEAAQQCREVFPLLPWTFDNEEMQSVLDFEHKMRPTPLVKDLLTLPCMNKQTVLAGNAERSKLLQAEGALWRGKYKALADASVQENRN